MRLCVCLHVSLCVCVKYILHEHQSKYPCIRSLHN
uniref:Uncharacterized protein n=1 Tax=Anguilla anguilla TaxID=7936 RepID=A0A0E9TYI5_ANGAN